MSSTRDQRNDIKLIAINPQPDQNGDIQPLSSWSGNCEVLPMNPMRSLRNNFNDDIGPVYYLTSADIQMVGDGQSMLSMNQEICL